MYAALLVVTVVVHVPLRLNSGAPTPPAVIARYEREFKRLGAVVDHPGVGSWAPKPSAPPSFEPDDHVFITTTPRQARAFLAAFLPRMRRELHQDATLGEIFGGWYGDPRDERRRVEAILPLTCFCDARLRAIHAVLDRAGGASQYDGLDGIHVYSSVPPAMVQRIVTALQGLRVAPQVTKSTFILAITSPPAPRAPRRYRSRSRTRTKSDAPRRNRNTCAPPRRC
jgi:hypothetical protein